MLAEPQTWDHSSLTWDKLSLAWDSATPPKTKTKKKPFRRKAANTNPQPPTPSNTMPTFKYNIAPLSSGGFTTRAVRGVIIDETALLAHAASAASITPEQVKTALKDWFNQLLVSAADNGWSPSMLDDLVSCRPTSGGSAEQPTDFHNAADINADLGLTFTAEAIRQWQATLSLESLGEVGKLTPVIESIINQANGAIDQYTPGNMVQLRGDRLRLDPADPAQGVFFKDGGAAEVRTTVYGTQDPGAISVLVPAGLSGALQVRVAAFINGSVRSYTYTNAITQSP